MCNACVTEHVRRSRLDAYNRNNYEAIYSAKMVDFYFPSGKKYREVFFTHERVRDCVRVEMWITNEQDKILGSVMALSPKAHHIFLTSVWTILSYQDSSMVQSLMNLCHGGDGKEGKSSLPEIQSASRFAISGIRTKNAGFEVPLLRLSCIRLLIVSWVRT